MKRNCMFPWWGGSHQARKEEEDGFRHDLSMEIAGGPESPVCWRHDMAGMWSTGPQVFSLALAVPGTSYLPRV